MKRTNNLESLTQEMLEDIKSLDGFKSPLIEDELVHKLSQKVWKRCTSREETIHAMQSMFKLGQVFTDKK